MKKEIIYIEQELKSNSASLIWSLISSEDGLSKWVADEVECDKDKYTFIWGTNEKDKEIRKANVCKVIKYSKIRFKWENVEDENTYLEFVMEKSDITNDYILCITDFAYPEEEDSLRDIWRMNFERLNRSTGL